MNDIIKTNGANVSPLEVDKVLQDCPGVEIPVTVGVPHETLGEMVVACVVRKAGAAVDERQVIDFASPLLSSFKVPKRVLFVAKSDLEFTPTSKVKRPPARELAKRLLAGGDRKVRGTTPGTA